MIIDREVIAKLEPVIAERCAKLADDVEQLVPPTGSFKNLFACFDDKTGILDITSWAVCVRYLDYSDCNQELLSKRYLDLIGYPGGNSCILQSVGSGSVKECAELLRSHDFVINVMEKMQNLLYKYSQM